MSLETCYTYTVMLALLAGAYTHTLTQLIVSVFITCIFMMQSHYPANLFISILSRMLWKHLLQLLA